jgi:DNA uptake protein ComE-like DNA-binding protein
MKNRTGTVLVALALCLAAIPTQAADAPPRKAGQVNATHAEKVVAKRDEAVRPAVQPVDINSASKAELKKLPGIGDAEADRVIAGRPYLSKAHLQTRNIVSPMEYQVLRDLVVARQKDAKFGKSVSK